MTTPCVPDFILNLFQNEIRKINLQMLEKFCKVFNVDIEDAKIKLKDQLNIVFEPVKNEIVTIVKKQKEIDPDKRCNARVLRKYEMGQCSRKKIEDCIFCKKHQKMNDAGKLKYSTIDSPVPKDIKDKLENRKKYNVY